MIIEPGAAAVTRCRIGATLALAAQLAFTTASAGAPPGDRRDEIGIQGRWAYSQQAGPDAVTDMATTPAAQDPDVWFLLACSGDGRLSVALMHTERFPFEVDAASSVQVQSERLSRIAVVAERSRPAQIVMDPSLVRHIMPMLLDEKEVAVFVTAKDGVVHRYSFVLQPNDVALAPLRARCSGD